MIRNDMNMKGSDESIFQIVINRVRKYILMTQCDHIYFVPYSTFLQLLFEMKATVVVVVEFVNTFAQIISQFANLLLYFLIKPLYSFLYFNKNLITCQNQYFLGVKSSPSTFIFLSNKYKLIIRLELCIDLCFFFLSLGDVLVLKIK